MTILSDADPAELNYMLPKVGLGLLFYKIKDHPPTKLNRTSLLDLLTFTRISVGNECLCCYEPHPDWGKGGGATRQH